jgi:cyclomaltodextrinase / maltogenic alpha-amylase / neopullulanase
MRFRVPAPDGARVELFGEMSDWLNPIHVDRDGHAQIALPRGVYQYKLRVTRPDGTTEWILDPDERRTRSAGGKRNNVHVVDGAPEPFLFAAAPPWIEELDRGGVRVLVGVRKGVPASSRGGESRALDAVAFSEGTTWTTVPLVFAFEEDEHRFFEAVLPASAPSLQLRIGSYETTWRRREARERPPDWWKRARLYGIFVDRFRPLVDRGDWETAPHRGAAAGGHLEGIRRSLDALSDLGIDVLYLTPVHVGASPHRYDIVDPLVVDPSLGGEEAFAALVADARARGMSVVQDVSFIHAGNGFPPWEDVRVHGRASRWASWFVWRGDSLVHYGKRKDAPLLDAHAEGVQALALESIERWARRGVRGLRLDMTAEVPLALGRRIRERFRAIVPDGVVFGEVVPQHAWRWRAERVVDAATDFAFHETITDLVCRPGASIADALATLRRTDLLRGGDVRTSSVRFVSTHDHARLASLAVAANATPRVPLAYVLLFTLPGLPMLLYGEELGLRSNDSKRLPEDVWPDRMPMPWGSQGDPELRALICALLHARRDSIALRSGTTTVLHADATSLVFRREADGDVVDVALGFEDATFELEDDERPRMSPLALIGRTNVTGQSIALGSCSAAIVRRTGVETFGRRNLHLRDRDLVEAAAVASARPSRFLFSVTEVCNLRCQHCITHAPERTRDGTARTMTRAVLDSLSADFGLADYFAFVHGGESLTAPIFFDVLDRIAGARLEEPYVVHLLTNGVLLDVRTMQRLVAAGVRSISVSLDGATATTNDAIRTGGRFDGVLANLRAVLAARDPSLRVGLSYVVLAQNVAELFRFVDLAASLGVDWVKLEEGVPATAFAKRSLVSCDAADARDAIDRAVERGRERGLVMIDHTREIPIWRCALDARARAFLEADEFANSCILHPCRMPWETACVEPNGDVRLGDFFGPILGNVTVRPLAELWNARDAQEKRRAAARARICGSGPVTCV